MSKYQFSKRLKRMLDNECEITLMETRLARKTAKYNEEVSKLKTIAANRLDELQSCRDDVERLKSQNDRLEKFVHDEEHRLAGMVQNTRHLKKVCDDAMQRRTEQRKGSQMKMDLIRKIKTSTQTYFNMDALPHTFQGVKVIEKEKRSEWKPFVNDVQQWIQFLEEQLELMKQKELSLSSSIMDKDMTMEVEGGNRKLLYKGHEGRQ